MTGADLATQRHALGLSQSQLAHALGLSPRTLQNWEQGTRQLPFPVLVERAMQQLAEETAMQKQLTYNSDDGRYHGVQSDGTAIEIDADAYAEARQQRERDGMDYHTADEETADPDGWSLEMDGWIDVVALDTAYNAIKTLQQAAWERNAE